MVRDLKNSQDIGQLMFNFSLEIEMDVNVNIEKKLNKKLNCTTLSIVINKMVCVYFNQFMQGENSTETQEATENIGEAKKNFRRNQKPNFNRKQGLNLYCSKGQGGV